MEVLGAALFTFLLSGAIAGQCKHPYKTPVFETAHSVAGTLYIPYAELREPFEGWYDLEANASRIDYYGGMVKTYQLANTPISKFGSSLKIAPVTTEDQLNVNSCLQVNGTEDSAVTIQSILPDLSGFKCLGQEIVRGVQCEKWGSVETIGEKVNKYTMYIKWKKSPKTPKVVRPVPVRYEMKGFNSLLGSHFDHYYLEYDSYSFDKPDPKVFTLDSKLTCQSFPGPGVDHVLTFNPMKEFVHNHDSHVDHAFDKFKANHGKVYQPDEHAQRKEIFRQNLRFIHSNNRANRGFAMSVNHLADRTDDEMKALMGRKHSGVYNGGKPFPYVNAKEEYKPDHMDWRLYGAVTPVKDQAVCGSCWSFGTTGAVEGAYFVKTGHLLRLSQQALVDCSWGYGNNGCDGGEDFRAYQWIMKHGGLPLESDYGQYLGQDGYCRAAEVTAAAAITGWVNVTAGDREALKVAIFKHGPISVGIYASLKSFGFYSHGVFYDPQCKNAAADLNHAVLAVGYGKLNGKPYWLVKNSWSNLWGNDGYVLIAMKDNNCGVMTTPTYVTM